ncbi:MAG: conjugal transfer protein TraC, partial [Eggerthellaceae bacterium]|nr:conjugal transfer protein TraC [Eggerthellaceae bacterium]
IDLPFPVNISVHTQAAAPGQDVNYVKERLSWMDKDIADKQMRSVARGHDAGLIPQDLAYSKDEAEELLDQLLYKNQRLFRFTAAIYTFADTYEKLQEQVLEIIRAGKNSALTIDAAACQQKQGLNTVLPLGMNHMFHERHLTTAQLGMLMPFATLEIFLKSGGYYGQNHESKNLIILDRKTMSNPAGWIFGTPGSGKSFAVKREITNTRLIHPEDEIYIVDPNNEYTLLTSSLGGENFILSNSGGDRVNLFDFYEGSEEVTGEDPVSAKAETVMAICSTVLRGTDGSGLSAHDVSVVDRCVRLTYERFFDSPTPPTLGDFYETLCAQPDAGGLPGALELYVTGSAAAFNSATTVDIQRGMTCFSFKALGKNMRTFAMLVILDFVYNRMLYNFHRGVRTWVYVDEAQSMFDDPGVLAYFDRFWSEGRKFGLIPTAISQNADRVFANEQARTTLSNSDFLMLFRQAKADRALLASLLNLSSQQEKYIDKSCADGSGLLCVKAARVCFEDNFPKGRLYDLWNTKPEEIAERRRAQWMQRQTAAAVAAEAE